MRKATLKEDKVIFNKQTFIEVLKWNVNLIEFILNPGDEMINIVISKDVNYYKKINNPSVKLKKKVIDTIHNHHGYYNNFGRMRQINSLINFAKESEEIKRYLVSKDIEYLKYIKRPSKELKLFAINKNYKAIKYIRQPTEEMQLIAFKKSKRSLKYIKKPCDKLKTLLCFS